MALTGATLGKTGIVSTDEKLLQNQRVGNIFPTDSRMLEKKFLFFILLIWVWNSWFSRFVV